MWKTDHYIKFIYRYNKYYVNILKHRTLARPSLIKKNLLVWLPHLKHFINWISQFKDSLFIHIIIVVSTRAQWACTYLSTDPKKTIPKTRVSKEKKNNENLKFNNPIVSF